MDLFPFNNRYQEKYRWLGLKLNLVDMENPEPEEVKALREIIEDSGIRTTINYCWKFVTTERWIK